MFFTRPWCRSLLNYHHAYKSPLGYKLNLYESVIKHVCAFTSPEKSDNMIMEHVSVPSAAVESDACDALRSMRRSMRREGSGSGGDHLHHHHQRLHLQHSLSISPTPPSPRCASVTHLDCFVSSPSDSRRFIVHISAVIHLEIGSFHLFFISKVLEKKKEGSNSALLLEKQR